MKIYSTLSNLSAMELTVKLVSQLPRDIDKKIYVFCESKCAFSYEKAITDNLGGTFNTTVLSFARYVALNSNIDKNKYLSKSQGSLLVRKLMKDNEEKLLKIKANAFSVPKDIYELISQLKSALVRPKDLDKIIEGESSGLSVKLKDIKTIFSAYEDFLVTHGLTDESNFLSLMIDAVKNDDNLKGANVIVSGMQSYTKQTLEILKALNKVANVDFVCVSSSYPAYTGESVNQISGAFKGAEDIFVNDNFSKEQLLIAKNMFEPSSLCKQGEYSDKIIIHKASDINEECLQIAKRIRYEVVCNNYRYKDFCIVCSDVSTYSPSLKDAFSLYDIPLYEDEDKALDKHPVIGLIGGLIDIKRFNLMPAKVISFVKNRLVCPENESSAFANYVLDNSLSRRQMLLPFDDIIAESVRARVAYIYQKLQKKDTVTNYVKAILDIFNYLEVDNRTKEISQELLLINEGALAEFNEGSLKGIYQLLQEIDSVLGDTYVDLNELKNIIITGGTTVQVSSLPRYNDTVFLGDFKSGRNVNPKIMFVVGLTADVPNNKADVALLNDRELIKMDGYKLIIEPKLEIVNSRAREDLTVCLLGFKDKLILSYPFVDNLGKTKLKSQVIDYIKSIFQDSDNCVKEIFASQSSNLGISKAEVYDYMSKKAGLNFGAKQIEDFREKKTADLSTLASFLHVLPEDEKLRFNQIMELTDKEFTVFDDKLSYNGNFSASLIENYFKCPYKSFVNYTLRLQESKTGDTKVNEIGTLIHTVMERFVTKMDQIDGNETIESLSVKLLDEELKTPLYAHYLNKSQNQCLFELIKDEVKKECKKIYYDFLNSDFKPWGTEVKFNESSSSGLGPVYLKTKNGTVKLRGVIDRIDTYDNHFRIIDYKTGTLNKNDIDEEFYTGRKIQLYLYMNPLCKNKLIPAGAYYYRLSDDFSNTVKAGGEYIGKTIFDNEIVSHMDKEYQTYGKSENLDVESKNGCIKSNKNTLDSNGFKSYADYAIKVCENGANEMLKGCIVPSPYLDACTHCKFKGLCGYDAEADNKTRKVSSVNKESIIKVTEDENE